MSGCCFLSEVYIGEDDLDDMWLWYIDPSVYEVFDIKPNVISSYSWPLCVSRWRVHSRAVVFQPLHRVQRDTRICPYLVCCANLYPLKLSQFRDDFILIPPFTPPSNPSPPPSPPSPPLPSPLPPLCQVPPVPTTASLSMPPSSYPSPLTGP